MSERMDLPCPYNCGFVYDIYDPLEGRRLLECPECGKPWILEVSYIPFIERRKVEGYSEHIPTEHEIEEDAKYFSEHPEELESGQNTTTNEQNIEESEQKPDNQNMCSKCGFVFEDHNIAPEGICPVCFLDVDNVTAPGEFQNIPGNCMVDYRCCGDQVELRYMKYNAFLVQKDYIIELAAKLNAGERISDEIKRYLNTNGSNKVTALNQFVKAVATGKVEI